MIKGGYKIVNFNGAALSGTAVTLSGIYDQIVDDFDKPIMVSGVSLNGNIMDDAYAGVQEKVAGDLSKSVELTVYGGIITVTEDDEVSFVVSKTTAELNADIGKINDILMGVIPEGTKEFSAVFSTSAVYSSYRAVIYIPHKDKTITLNSCTVYDGSTATTVTAVLASTQDTYIEVQCNDSAVAGKYVVVNITIEGE